MRLYWMFVGLAAMAAVALLVPHSSSSSPREQPDKAFARVLKVAYEQANPGVFISEDVCTKTGTQVVCAALATKNGKPWCFVAEYGPPLKGALGPCEKIVALIRKATKPSWRIVYPRGFVA